MLNPPLITQILEADFPVITKTKQNNGLWTLTGESIENKDSINSEEIIDILARTIWGEARGESREGKEAVATVILNRLKKPTRFGNTIKEVCLKPFQFSCWNEDDPNLPKLKAVNLNNVDFVECLSIAKAAVTGDIADTTIGADHYHTNGMNPNWSRSKTPCKIIGNHLFYNNIP